MALIPAADPRLIRTPDKRPYLAFAERGQIVQHEEAEAMDITVTRAADDPTAWTLTDLLRRPLGRVTGAGRRFVIEPQVRAGPALTGLRWEPYASLDEAL